MKGSMIVIGVGAKPKPKPPGFLGRKGEEAPPPKEKGNPFPPKGNAPGPHGEANRLSPERAGFHNQEESCAQCRYFDPDAGDQSQGECKKVQVDYSSSMPDASWCNRFEAGSEEAEETPQEETKEQEKMGMMGKGMGG